jgi:hypothetical protein
MGSRLFQPVFLQPSDDACKVQVAAALCRRTPNVGTGKLRPEDGIAPYFEFYVVFIMG